MIKEQSTLETNHIEAMIDIETMGTTAGSPILTIGAVLFDPRRCDSIDLLERRSLLIRIDVSDAIKHSEGVDGTTLRWWLEQEDAAIKELVGDDLVSTEEALLKLSRYCKERGDFTNNEFFEGISQLPEATSFWAKDPDFDMVLLRYVYDLLNIPLPWKFWECRSVRTIQDLAWADPGDRPKFAAGTLHDARADAISQAMLVQAAYKELGKGAPEVELSTYK